MIKLRVTSPANGRTGVVFSQFTNADSFTNLQEYQGGTDPQDDSSHPTADVPGLVARYSFDTGSGIYAFDLTADHREWMPKLKRGNRGRV